MREAWGTSKISESASSTRIRKNEHWEPWKMQGSPAEKHFKQKKEKRICTEGHEGHKEMGREHARAKVRSCDVTSAAAGR